MSTAGGRHRPERPEDPVAGTLVGWDGGGPPGGPRPPGGEAANDERHRGTVAQLGHEGHSFEAVESVVANPFPPGTDPATIRLPSVPRLRSPEDNEANHHLYWQAHLWETLLRYRRADHDPACPDRLRAGYEEVAEVSLRLAERATSAFPLSPIDSVGCHSTLKELRASALGLEATVAALADGAGAGETTVGPARPTDFTSVMATVAAPVEPVVVPAGGAPVAATASGSVDPVGADGGGDPGGPERPDASGGVPLTQDLFAHPSPSRSSDSRLSLRGARGLRRGRNLAGDATIVGED